MKFRGRSFEHLFLIRAQDDFFPQRRIEDPLFPDSDRRALTLREIGTGRDEEQLLFDLVLDGATSVHVSYASSDGFGKILRKSRSVKGYGPVERQAPSPVVVARTGEGACPSTRATQLFAQSGSNSPFDGNIPSLSEHFTKALQPVSPTQLEDSASVPQKFLFKHILGVRRHRRSRARAADQSSRQRDARSRHPRALLPLAEHRRHRRRGGRAAAARRRGQRSRLERARSTKRSTDLEQRGAAVQPDHRATIERTATKRILRDFVGADLADLAETATAARSTSSTASGKDAARGRRRSSRAVHRSPQPALPIRVEGTIDRIDMRRGRLRIVDYKSGKALRHQKTSAKKIDRGVRLQLALYAMAVVAILRRGSGDRQRRDQAARRRDTKRARSSRSS